MRQNPSPQPKVARRCSMPHRNIPNIPLRTVRALVTGAGGPAAVSVMKSLSADPSVSLIAADMDPWAAGLYLVPPEARTLIPAGLDPEFVDAALARCIAMGVDVLIPTVDAELRPLGRARADFSRAGIELLLAPDQALDVTLDKLALAQRCAGIVRVPRTERFDQAADLESWTYPVVVKPRTGSGSGERFSSGVSVAGRTLHDAELERLGPAVATVTGLTYIANVQFRRDAAGRPALLEVNPRVPGA